MGGPESDPLRIPKGGKSGRKGEPVPMRKLLPPALLEGNSRIMLVYPGREFTDEYSAQIRRGISRKGLNLVAADNFRDAVGLLRASPLSFGMLISALAIPRTSADSLLLQSEPGLGRQLAEIALSHNPALRAIVDADANYEVRGPGIVHAVPKGLEGNPVLTFQKLVLVLMPSGAETEKK